MPTFTGIHNVTSSTATVIWRRSFAGDIQTTLERWHEQAESAGARILWAELRTFAPDYVRFRGDFNHEHRPRPAHPPPERVSPSLVP